MLLLSPLGEQGLGSHFKHTMIKPWDKHGTARAGSGDQQDEPFDWETLELRLGAHLSARENVVTGMAGLCPRSEAG